MIDFEITRLTALQKQRNKAHENIKPHAARKNRLQGSQKVKK